MFWKLEPLIESNSFLIRSNNLKFLLVQTTSFLNLFKPFRSFLIQTTSFLTYPNYFISHSSKI